MRTCACLIVGVACVVAGCRTKEMASTPFYEGNKVAYVGAASERVNFWPIAYWRNPVGSVAWPFVSFSDDHWALRPVYSQYKQSGKDGAWDEFNLAWPIVQADMRNETYRVFPLYWDGPHYNALFPLWYYGSTTNSWSFNTLAGLAGVRETASGYRSSWTFPLWYEDNTGLFSTLLYGQTRSSHWFFPLWYKGEKAFVSPLYAQGADGDDSWWSVPVALSWGKGTKGTKMRQNKGRVFLGLGGWDHDDWPDYRHWNWWAFPLVQRTWTLRLKAGHEPSVKTFVAGRLFGWKTKGEKLTSLYAFPLFSWEDYGSWMTALGGRLHSCGTTNTYFTPLVRVITGQQTGGAVCPVWSHKKDVDFDAKVALIDSAALPPCIKVTSVTNAYKRGKHYGKTYWTGKPFHCSDENSVLLHDADHSMRGRSCGYYDSATNAYQIIERRKRGNALLLNCTAEREVTFDLKTKAKLSDVEKSEARLLLGLYRKDWRRDRLKGDECRRHRVLERLWNWEEKNGDVALDVFPGFTYDRRKDGYSKTSFLCRLFRNEWEPKSGRKVDVLFIPVWR